LNNLNLIKHLKCYVSSLGYGGGGEYIKITYKCCEDVPKVPTSGDDSVKNYTNGRT
jgi:hypothetical protein